MAYAIPNSEESCSAQRAVAALGTKHTSSASKTFSGGHEQSMETWSNASHTGMRNAWFSSAWLLVHLSVTHVCSVWFHGLMINSRQLIGCF